MDTLKKKLVNIHFQNFKESQLKEPKKYIYIQNIHDFGNRFISASKDYDYIQNLIERMNDQISKKESALLRLSSYLIFTEGVICNCFDLICYILIVDHHDLCDFIRKNKYASTIDDIAKISMSQKVGFLNNHGFKELTKNYDMELRNCIAHHKYRIDDNGDIWIKGEKLNILENSQQIFQLLGFFNELINSLFGNGSLKADS